MSNMAEREGSVIYHCVRADDDFDTAAQSLFGLVRRAQEVDPGGPRYLCLDIEGHRNSKGGFDSDMFELCGEFLLGFLMRYLTEATTPLGRYSNSKPQDDDIPQTLQITPPDGSSA